MNGPFGIIRGEDIRAYHANDAVSSTRLMDLHPSAQFYFMRHVAKTLPKEAKREFDLGNAAHWLILEGRKALEERTVLQPATYPAYSAHKVPLYLGEKPWHNGAGFCDRWTAEQEAKGKVVLTADDFATIDKMAAAVAENPDAMALLTGGESEVTFRVQHPAFAVQCRADMWHESRDVSASRSGEVESVCVDLKTCDTIERFRSEYFNLRYAYRAVFYQDVIASVVGERPAFLWVAVEKNAPWRCEVFQPSEDDLELARNEVLADLKTLRRCFEENHWENSRPGIQTIELTPWQKKIMGEAGASLFEEASATC